MALRGTYGSAIWAMAMAVCTLVATPTRSSASWSTSAFITVPSMPT